MKRVSLSVGVLLLLCGAAYAQQSATTTDGKKVVLNTDGTWKYADASSTVTLRIEAGLVYQTGGPEPVARATFYVLDDFPLDEMKKLANGAFATFAATCGAEPDSARELIARHIVYKVTTGFDGRGELSGVKPGQYWLFGGAKTRRNCALWLKQIDLTKDQDLILDQNNAVTAQ
jgi:hypothetical protein